MTPEPRPGAIPALTGLRFIAAISVVLAHGLSAMTIVPGAEPFWRTSLTYASAFGMTAFFVLSGFVIHYNYAGSIIEHRWRGTANFFSARFARLYPLYIVCIIWALYDYGYFFMLLSGHHPDLQPLAWQLFPYYLTLTQSWKFSIVGSNALVNGFPFSHVAQITWSVSTELFFYLVYPLICFASLRLRHAWQTIATMAVVSAIGFGMLRLAFIHAEAIDQFGVDQYGPIAGMAHGFQDSFLRWLIYFAPYTRLPEFILGCLVAALYRQTARFEPSAREQHLGLITACLSVFAAGAMTVLISLPSKPLPFLQFLHLNFGYALPVAALIFCLARYRNFVTSALSHRIVVLCGDASYSIYLLHISIIHSAGLNVFNVGQNLLLTSVVLLRLVLAMVITVAFSLVTYRLIEVPARRWLRRLLTVDVRAVSPVSDGRQSGELTR